MSKTRKCEVKSAKNNKCDKPAVLYMKDLSNNFVGRTSIYMCSGHANEIIQKAGMMK